MSSEAVWSPILNDNEIGREEALSEEQIIGFLREAEAGIPIKDLCRQHGFSKASDYLWRSKFGGMRVPDAKRLRELEAENARLKNLLGEQVFENDVIKGCVAKSGDRAGAQAAGAEHGREGAERAASGDGQTDERERAAL